MQVLSYKAYVEGSIYPARFPDTRSRLTRPLELFLRFFDARDPGILEQVRPKLMCELGGCLATAKQGASAAIYSEPVNALGLSEENDSLIQVQGALQRELLGIGNEVWAGEEAVDLSQVVFFRALYLPQYLQLKALIDVLGKQRGIQSMRDCLDWAYMQGPDHPNAPKTIDELRTRQAEGNIRGKGMDWIAAVISEHEYRNKVTTCLIQKALVNYGDSELLEVVACYPDFTMFRKINPSFSLTRTQTLMSGGDCCDMCYHDERYVADFVHPPAEVFDAMKVEPAS